MILSTLSLQLEAQPSGALLGVLAGGAMLVLAAAGGLQIVRGRRRMGLATLSAAAVAAGLMVVVAVAGGLSGRTGLVTLGVLLMAASGVLYAPAVGRIGSGRAVLLAGLRCAAIAVLLVALFKPAAVITAAAGGPHARVTVLVDRSGSMGTVDPGTRASRYATALQALGTQQARLEAGARVRYLAFADQATQAGDFDSLRPLTADGTATNIAAAISAAAEAPAPGAILLLTDGIDTAATPVPQGKNTPVWAVGVGSTTQRPTGRNLRIDSVNAPLQAVKDNVTAITVRVELSQLARTPLRLELFEAGQPAPAASAPLWTEKDLDTATVTLNWTPRPRAPGATGADVRRLRIAVAPAPRETRAQDNAAQLHILVTQPEIRVLYIEGTIRPEYKFLRRLLDSDPAIRFASLIRISDDRFLSYSREAGSLQTLPTTPDDFKKFNVLVLGSLDRRFLGEARMEQIRRFVDGGGGLLMLGGRSSFGAGHYGGSPVEQALPVIMGDTASQDTTALLPVLTAAGQVHPILQGLEDFFSLPGRVGPKPGTAMLGPLDGCVEVAPHKPGAALAVHPTRRNASGPLVILAAQQYGKGRSVAMTADTTWKWQFAARGTGSESPYSRLWGQMIRWLARGDSRPQDAAAAVVMRINRPLVRAGEAITVQARVQTALGLPADDARVTCTTAGALPQTLALARRGPGRYEAPLTLTAGGEHQLTVSAVDSAGKGLGRDEMTVTVLAPSAEMQRLARDEPALRRIAEHSGGRYADLSALPEVVDEALARAQSAAGPATPAKALRLYNSPAAMILFAMLLTAELVLRRRWQLR